MGRVINSVLVADGSSDRVLLGFIDRLMREHCPFAHRPADFVRAYPDSCRALADRVRHALNEYPSDVVFVHRDAERRNALPKRQAELDDALKTLQLSESVVLIVPVLMTESWLLVDAKAIRHAAGNPRGDANLQLPRINQIEGVDAKECLFSALTRAADLSRRRAARLNPEAMRHRVVDFLDDLTLLRRLPSFCHFEAQVEQLFAGQFGDH